MLMYAPSNVFFPNIPEFPLIMIFRHIRPFMTKVSFDIGRVIWKAEYFDVIHPNMLWSLEIL